MGNTIGKLKNKLKFGKGKIYYNDGKIKYDGEFIDDKFEGFGKYFSTKIFRFIFYTRFM